MSSQPTIIINPGPSWAQILVPAGLGLVALLLAAWLGTRLQARSTWRQTLELHRVGREQDALLRFLDLLAKVDLVIRRSLPGPQDVPIRWSEAVAGVGAKMLRETPGVTWDRSNEPDVELYQWGTVVSALFDTEEEWRDHLAARVNRPDIAKRWWKIFDRGAGMGLKGSAVTGPHLQAIHEEVLALMVDIRELT